MAIKECQNDAQDFTLTAAASTAVAIGDLVYNNSGAQALASAQADGGTEAANQETFAGLFAGVAMETRLAAETDTRAVRVRGRGVFDASCDSATWAVGDLVAAVEQSNGTQLENQKVKKTTDQKKAIGICVKAGTSLTTVRVELWSRLLRPVTGTGALAADSLDVGGISGSDSSLGVAGQAAAQGGAVALTGGTSSTSANAGGAVTVVGGTPGATGVGGAVTLTGGVGGSTSGAGGAVTVTAGAAATSGGGGAVTITGGAGAGGTNAGGHVNLVGGAAVSTGLPGEVQVNGDANLFFVTEALTATDATRTVLVATRACRLKSVKEVHTTASTSGTLTLEKCTGTTAPGSGTTLLTGTMSLAGTANTVVSGTLIATVASLTFAAGDRLSIVIAGTMTNLAGARVTIGLVPC